MTGSSPPSNAAFRKLHRALVRRRVTQIEWRLRVEIAALAALITGFIFWQARLPFDSLARARGPGATALAAATVCAVLAAIGGALAGSRHARQLARGPAGPEWLALPLTPRLLARHLEWESSLQALWAAVPAPGILAAAAGLVPAPWLLGLAVAFAAALLAASRLGCAVALRLALARAGPRAGLDPLAHVLAPGRDRARPAAARAVRWRPGPAWRALWSKDLVLCRRPTAARRRIVLPVVLAALAGACWALPVPPPLARLISFALALLAAAAAGEWLIALSAEDPFPVLRGLPVGAFEVWGERALLAALASAVLVTAVGLCAARLGPVAHQVFLVWTGAAALAITLLAVNMSVTLFPRAEAAQRLFGLSLGIAVAASLMIPLLGWLALAVSFLHSGRRLGRWSWLEERT